MFTKDQLSALLHANGKEGIMAIVNQIPEDELRNALVRLLLCTNSRLQYMKTCYAKRLLRYLQETDRLYEYRFIR